MNTPDRFRRGSPHFKREPLTIFRSPAYPWLSAPAADIQHRQLHWWQEGQHNAGSTQSPLRPLPAPRAGTLRAMSAVRIGSIDVLRHGALDLLTAASFLLVWLLREQFSYDTLRGLLLWPVVFECYLAFALFLASWVAGVRSTLMRWTWIAAVLAIYLGGAWLTVATAESPAVWTLAVWLLFARALPPRGMPVGTPLHLRWLQRMAGFTGLLWGAAFIAFVLLMLVFPGAQTLDADGTLRSTPPAWIFPLVWTPYFVAEAVLRARLVLEAQAVAPKR